MTGWRAMPDDFKVEKGSDHESQLVEAGYEVESVNKNTVCLKEADDFACGLQIKAPQVSYSKVCSRNQNALCMRAEGSVDGSVRLCWGEVMGVSVPYFAGSITVDGSAGACGADGAGPSDPQGTGQRPGDSEVIGADPD